MMQTAERTRFTEAEMATVRNTDLPDLLISLGYQVKRIGRYYTTQEMDSIRIKDRRTWFRYSEGIGGDAITFLQRFYNKSFPEAVEYLLTWHGRARDSPPASTPRQTKEKEEKFPFTLPPANVDHRRVFAYLRKRGIAPQVIRGFVEAGLLYEDAQHHNCVFVGRDQSGAPVFANQRGTYTAVATYTGSATSSYVKGYTVTADYTGTVSRIALNRVRYVAIFEGTPIQPAEPANVPSAASAFRWSYVLIPLGIVAAAGAGVGGALLVKHRKENADEEDATE